MSDSSDASSSSDDEVVQTRRFTRMSSLRQPTPTNIVLPAKKKTKSISKVTKSTGELDVGTFIKQFSKEEKKCKVCNKKKATRKCLPCKCINVCGKCAKKAYKSSIKSANEYKQKIAGLSDREKVNIQPYYLPSCLTCDLDVQKLTKVTKKRVIKIEKD